MIRQFGFADLVALQRIHKETSFPFPDLNSPLYFVKCIYEKDGEIQAGAFIKLTSESIIIMDESLPKVTKVKILTSLINQLQVELQALSLEDTHVFLVPPDPNGSENFLKSFGFVRATGIPMYLPPKENKNG